MKHLAIDLFGTFLLCGASLGSGPQRLPVPDRESQVAADTSIKSVLRDDFAKPEVSDRVALVDKLIQLASESQNNTAGRFALLKEAQNVAVQAGDADAVLRAVEATTSVFDLDPLGTELAALLQSTPNAKTPPAVRSLIEVALRLTEEATMAAQFDVASRSIGIASTGAEKFHDKQLTARIQRAQTGVARARKQYAKAQEGLKRLQASPSDAEADTSVGTFLCGTCGDWTRGIPYLVHGSDPDLQILAKHEQSMPATAAGMMDLADGWWSWAEKGEQPEWGRSRAAYWYERAAPDLPGLKKALAERRVEQANSVDVGDRVINLIPLIDLKRDSVKGSWTIRGGSLINTDPVEAARVRVRYQPPAEYDFRVTFVRRDGSEAVNQMLLVGGHRFNWTMAGLGNSICGFELIAGERVTGNPTTFHGGPILKNGERYTSVVKVRRDSIAAYLDGKLIASYRTDFSDLTPEPGWDVGPNALGVGSWTSRTEFLAVELLEISRGGMPLGPIP